MKLNRRQMKAVAIALDIAIESDEDLAEAHKCGENTVPPEHRAFVRHVQRRLDRNRRMLAEIRAELAARK